MNIASGVRIGWVDLPTEVRLAVEQIIGAPVVEAVSQSGGFSPGTADRVRTADGRRAFVKAVSPDQNDQASLMHRREVLVAGALPPSAPAPQLLGHHDDGHWIALVFEDVEGRAPATPWQPEELEQVFAALADLATALTPAPVPELIGANRGLAEELAGWHRIAADPPPGLDPWAALHLDRFCALADRGVAALAGDTLVHSDLRADNLLITPQGTVMVVDWPHACLGPAWLDTLLLLINVRLFDEQAPTAMVDRVAARFGADREDLIAVLAAATGYFLDIARRPPPPGLPTVRAFQQAQGDAVLAWLHELGAVK